MAIFECNIEEEMRKIGNDYYEEGFENGLEEGKLQGLEEGKLQGLEEGKLITILSLYSKGTITKAKALEELDTTEEEFMKALKKYQN